MKQFSYQKFWVLIIITVILAISAFFFANKFIEPKVYDFFVRLSSSQKASSEIVNVVIDDESLSKIGRWPWKRTYYADIFEYLENYANVNAIAFDSIISSYGDKQSDKEFFERLNNLNQPVLGMFFTKNIQNQPELASILNKHKIKMIDLRKSEIIKKTNYSGISHSLKEILSSNQKIGSVLIQPDEDGIIRKLEPFVLYNSNYYPSMSLAIYSKIKNSNEFIIKKNEFFNDLDYFTLQSEDKPFLFIKWYKPYKKGASMSHKSYSAWQIIKSYEQIKNGQKPMISPGELNGKIIVVGATATALNDFKPTPLGLNYPGVDIQATCIDNFLNNDFLVKLPEKFNILAISLLSITIFALAYSLSILYSILFSTFLMFAYLIFCLILFSKGYTIAIATPIVFSAFSMTAGFAIRYFIENIKKQKFQTTMAKYVSKNVMANVLKDEKFSTLGGRKKEITVLFADIRGFTTLSETLEPEEVSEVLNSYFTQMVPIVEKYNGVVNKFIGDALMAIFGDVSDNENHPQNAVLCANEMLKTIKNLQKKWHEEGKPKIEIGIGINTGLAFVGNIGTESRMEYTAIGDTINLASRIEAHNRIYHTKLLISDFTHNRVKNIVDTIKISSVEIKGRNETVDIYEVINLIQTNDSK
ncbi:MAG: adenylate/guanylate cyclase domain-containing protein [Candidatus Gastranaerophilales bacterium]|nr:adenylate/guanylate cyclase domain-containing protein [Candidatus Gastranaerophilales bacterium]